MDLARLDSGSVGRGFFDVIAARLRFKDDLTGGASPELLVLFEDAED